MILGSGFKSTFELRQLSLTSQPKEDIIPASGWPSTSYSTATMEIHFRFLNSKERTQIRLEDNYLARGKHMREISWSGIQPNILTRNSTKKTFLVEQQTTIVSTFPVCFFIDFHPGKCKSKQSKAVNLREWGRGGRWRYRHLEYI